MKFKNIRSFVGKFFSEKAQMHFLVFASRFFWSMRKYFLGVEIKYPEEFKRNWSSIKMISSQDSERNFTLYQLIKMHNNLFRDKQTNIIEFGTDRGGTLTTISKFIKKNSKIFAIDSFGLLQTRFLQTGLKKIFQIMMNITKENTDRLQKKHDLKILTIKN